MKKKALVSWSRVARTARGLCTCCGGAASIEIAGLLTTMNAAFDRVAMHGTRRELVEAQAEAAGLPLITVPLPWPCSNEQYEAAMREACARAVADGVEVMAFGDLFLEDVRKYQGGQAGGIGADAGVSAVGIADAGAGAGDAGGGGEGADRVRRSEEAAEGVCRAGSG